MAAILPATVADWRAWLAGEVLPWWLATVAAGPDGYVETLAPGGQPDRRPERTPLVTARLVYAFSHAHWLGLSDRAREAAERGFRFLVERCWDPAEGGFFHRISPTGAPLDPRKDTYDQAFALFACAWLHRATGAREPLDWAARIIEAMDRLLLDCRAGGYREHHWAGRTSAEGQPLPRRQNPHMHLLEAFLALHEATGDEAWLHRAVTMVELFKAHFFDRASGTLGEFFDEAWRPASGPAGRTCEPGHHFEWVWLLHHYSRLSGDGSLREPADRLYRFACRHGLDRDPAYPAAAFDEVERNGSTVTASKLLWPQTEAIKAALARWEFLGDRAAARLARSHTALLFERYLLDGTARWCTRLGRDGAPGADPLPVRVFYHLFLCFAELLRLWPTLPAAGDEPPTTDRAALAPGPARATVQPPEY